MWALFEANLGSIDKARKLLKIGHLLNPRDPVLLQSLALLEYKHSSANVSRVLFRRASELDPRHQPVWIVSRHTKHPILLSLTLVTFLLRSKVTESCFEFRPGDGWSGRKVI